MMMTMNTAMAMRRYTHSQYICSPAAVVTFDTSGGKTKKILMKNISVKVQKNEGHLYNSVGGQHTRVQRGKFR